MAQIDPRDLQFRKMLTKLATLITNDEFNLMTFMSKSAGIGDRIRQNMTSPLDLWERLEERGFLGYDKLSFLTQLLSSCTNNRSDVLDVVKQYEQYRHVDSAAGTNANDLQKQINFLVDNLGKDWKFFMRALGLQESKLDMCVESHPRNVREQIHMAFKEWQSDGSPKLDTICNSLKEIHRNDLCIQVKSLLEQKPVQVTQTN